MQPPTSVLCITIKKHITELNGGGGSKRKKCVAITAAGSKCKKNAILGSNKCHCHTHKQKKKRAPKRKQKKKQQPQPIINKKMITPLVNPSNYCFGNAVVQLLSLLKLSWDNCPDFASLLQTMRHAQGTVSAKNFITSMGFNPNNPSDAMALLNRVLTQENPEETRWRTQVFDNFWQPGDPPGSRAEPQRDEHSILIDTYEDTLEEAITTSLVKHHVTGFVNKTKHIMSYPKIAIFELGCNRRRRGCKLPKNLTLGNHNYTLAATINFVGKSTKNGHYTAITKSKNGWALCNDSAITRVSEGQVHQITEGINERAIGVCYTRADVELNIKSSGDNNPNPWVMPKPKPKSSKDKQHDILFFGPNRGQHPIISIRRLLEYIGAHDMATQEMVWEKDTVSNNEHIRIRASAEARYAFNFKMFTWRARSVCGDWRFCPQDPTPTFKKFTKHVNAQVPTSKKTPPKKGIDFGPLPVQWKTPDNSYTRNGMVPNGHTCGSMEPQQHEESTA